MDMRFPAHSPQQDKAAAARAWLARLHAHDCTDDERAAFRQWHDADPAHAAVYADLSRLWQGSAAIRQHDSAFSAALQQARRPAHRNSRWRAWWPALVATAGVVLAVAGWRVFMSPDGASPVRYATGIGEQRSIVLEDGSRLSLDTATEVEVDYGRRERRLVLVQGQAEFNVQHDRTRPFIVAASGNTITATGTQFQVRWGPAGGAVTLLEGQVVVTSARHVPSAPGKVTLAPGERLAFDAGGAVGQVQVVPEAERARLRGWTEGQLVVRDWPLAAVVNELNRYSFTRLELADASLEGLLISGRFKTTDPETFALSMEYGWSIQAQHPHPNRIVLHRRE